MAKVKRDKVRVARYEIAEFIIGNAFLAGGGSLISLGTVNEFTAVGTGLVVAGAFLDYRVFNKSRYDREELNEKLRDTRDSLDEAILEMDEQKKLLDAATARWNKAMHDMQKQKKELEEMQDKTFSFFSRVSSSKPIEDLLKEMREKMQSMYEILDRDLQEVERSLNIRKWRHFRV